MSDNTFFDEIDKSNINIGSIDNPIDVTENEPVSKRPRYMSPDIITDGIQTERPSREEICIGHAMATVSGGNITSNLKCLTEFTGDSDIIAKQIKILMIQESNAPVNNNVLSISLDSIEGHETILSVLYSHSTYYWYYNPWGLRGDYNYHMRLHKKVIDLIGTDKPKSERLDDSIFSYSHPGINKDSPDHIRNYYMCLKLFCSVPDDIIIKALTWGKEHMPGKQSFPPGHVMMATYILQLLRESHFQNDVVKKIHVLHPAQTMSDVGLQSLYNDGISNDKTKTCGHISRKLGACSVWACIHARVAKKLASNMVSSTSHHDDILELITDTLKSPSLYGSRNVRYLLGKIAFFACTSNIQRTVMKYVYKYIPELPSDKRLASEMLKKINHSYDINRKGKRGFVLFLHDAGVFIGDSDLDDFQDKMKGFNTKSAYSSLIQYTMVMVSCKHKTKLKIYE